MGKEKKLIIPNVVMISDPNADVDDFISFVVAAALADRKLINLQGIIATNGDAITRMRRAKIAKGAFMSLGYPFLEVATGGDYPIDNAEHSNFFCATHYSDSLEDAGVIISRNPVSVLQRALHKSQEKSLVIVINAQMSDVLNFLLNAGIKNLSKIKKIIIMGSAKEELDAEQMLVPDEKSYNNNCCMSSATQLYKFAQTNKINLVFATKETAYQTAFSFDFYEQIGKIDSNFAQCIYHSNKLFLENLWNTTKVGKFSHFDIKRFTDVFIRTDIKLDGNEEFASIWPQIQYFNLYDAIAILSSCDDTFKSYGHFEKICDSQKAFIAKIDDTEGFRDFLTDLVISKLKS